MSVTTASDRFKELVGKQVILQPTGTGHRTKASPLTGTVTKVAKVNVTLAVDGRREPGQYRMGVMGDGRLLLQGGFMNTFIVYLSREELDARDLREYLAEKINKRYRNQHDWQALSAETLVKIDALLWPPATECPNHDQHS